MLSLEARHLTAWLVLALRFLWRATLWVALVISVTSLVLGVILKLTVLRPFAADVEVKERQATVELVFDYINDLRGGAIDDFGRTLTVTVPGGSLTQEMCGWDWAHRGRTGIYLAGDDDLAVVGVDGCDYLIDPRRMTLGSAARTSSDDWVYLGAFDWVPIVVPVRPGRSGGNRRVFRFIPAAEQGECIIDSLGAGMNSLAVRGGARKDRCPSLPTEMMRD